MAAVEVEAEEVAAVEVEALEVEAVEAAAWQAIAVEGAAMEVAAKVQRVAATEKSNNKPAANDARMMDHSVVG